MQTPLRYVILRHESIDSPHFDLMFEATHGGALATWRSDSWPIEKPAALLRLADHRREYLTYEGALTGNRGSVRRIEAGTFVRRSESEDSIIIELNQGTTARVLDFSIDLIRGRDYWTARPL